MGILNKIKSLFDKNDFKGFIGHFDLDQWWESEFSEEEKEYIISKKPEIVEGSYNYIDKSPAKYLQELSLWFNTKKDSEISLKLLNKADELVDDIVEKHFMYNEMIKTNYKKRNEDEKYYNQAIMACEKQIKIADKVMEEMKKRHYERGKTILEYISGEKTLEEVNEDRPFRSSSHRGFKQLAIIKHKEGKYKEVIDLCKKAKKQGWNGDWDKRIERAEKKLNN